MATAWEIKTKKFKKLKGDIETEVLVIGGGLAGFWHAYLLSELGINVTIVDSKKLGHGATGVTTAFLNQEIDTNLTDLVKMFGKKQAKNVWLSHKEAIDIVEEVVNEEEIECEFERSSLRVYANNDDEYKILEEEYKTAKSLGFNTYLKRKNSLLFENCGMWEIKNQAKFHPLKFLNGLIDACLRNNVGIYEDTEVIKISDNGPIKIKIKTGNIITADKVIISTYKPFNNESTHFKKGMYVSYVIEATLPEGKIPSGMYLDMKDPYNYFRVDKLNSKSDRIIFGGADHRMEIKMSPAKNFKALQETMNNLFKGINYKIINKWTGPILEPIDGLALIGEIASNQYVATAFSGNGMTYSPMSAIINRDLILKNKNPWINIYDPKRPMRLKPLIKKAGDYTKEFWGGAVKNILK
jgi:glycine/D-amino acid oxidase-like deaminating enzyme